MSVLSGMPRSRKSRAKRRGGPSTSSRFPQRGNHKPTAQHTKGRNANQAPAAPPTPPQARGATDQESDTSRAPESRGAGSPDPSSNGQSRITSSERKREASAEKQTSDESDGPRLLRIAQEAFAGYSSSLGPRSSADDTTRQGCNRAGGWPSAVDYYHYYAWHWNTYGNYSQVLARGAWAQQWQPSANAPLLQFHAPPIQPPYAQPPLEPPPLLPAPTNQRAAGTCAGRIDISYTYVGAHAKIADWANAIRSMRLVVLIASCFDTEVAAHMQTAMIQLSAKTNTRGGGGSRTPIKDTQPN